MDFHEIANIFPLLEGAELDALVCDIKENGLLEPITTYEGKIVDGRNRYRACELAGVAPEFEEWKQNGVSLISWVIAKNLHRRHLTSSQGAACSLEAIPFFEAEAKKRQAVGHFNAPQYDESPVVEKIPQLESGYCRASEQAARAFNTNSHYVQDAKRKLESGYCRAREQAARAFNTNSHYVQDAKRIQEKRPELISKIKSGEITITQAKREIVRDEVKRELQLPSDKYRIIYADPPWNYSDKLSADLSNHYGGAEKHYPCMTIEQLCAMDVKSIADDDAVLFLWVTSPLLEECFYVIKAWGFKYKTSFVWDKVKHNMGHYNSVRHEFLLVCTRGSCTPENVKLFDSVQTIERTDKHSQKPEEFREIINTLYPSGRRIELFAREQSGGWEVYGNQL
jgi:N6-adenosine-specific RNA methylase IME4